MFEVGCRDVCFKRRYRCYFLYVVVDVDSVVVVVDVVVVVAAAVVVMFVFIIYVVDDDAFVLCGVLFCFVFLF